MDDDRNYIENWQARATAIHGREHSPDEMVRDFAKCSFSDRVNILDDLDRDVRSKSDEPLTARQAAQRRGSYDRYVDALRTTHEKLRRVGR